jgi:SAM-dependent methyltransferase
MGNEFMGSAAHSAEYFGDTRDFWYAPDFLRLMAARLGLGDVRDALDVGSGVGHWGQLLAPLLHPDAQVTGVDREPLWIERAAERARTLGLAGRFRYRSGLVEALPFADGTFDLVTCQTVLIHCRDPRAAVAEMIRVTRPGGLVLVSEPNNVVSTLLSREAAQRAPIDEVLHRVRFQMVCERGKEALGEGNNSLGEAVPGIFVELGLAGVTVRLNDKASPLLPPYEGPAARAQIEEERSFAERDFAVWSLADTRRYFLAGGGDEQDFEVCWAAALAERRRVVEAVAKGSFASAGGAVQYLISGRKPSPPNPPLPRKAAEEGGSERSLPAPPSSDGTSGEGGRGGEGLSA